MTERTDRVGLLEKLCLHTPETRAWALYDWANSAFVTTVIAAVFPIYYRQVIAADLPSKAADQGYSLATTLSLVAVALVAPLLGALGDYRGIRKLLLSLFLLLALGSTAGLFFMGRGDVHMALTLFGLANIGAAGSFVFYDSLLPHVSPPGRQDSLSTSGSALGYLGGGLLLCVQLAWMSKPELFGMQAAADAADPTSRAGSLPVRLALLSVAVWWGLFSIPLLRNVPEPPRAAGPEERSNDAAITVAFRRMKGTFRELYGFRNAFLMMMAFLLYNDGISTIIRMAAYLAASREFDSGVTIGAILAVQFVGVPFAILFARLSAKVGIKRAISIGVALYIGITVLAYWMRTEAHFIALAVAVGMVQGGTQALSRSLFASMIPKQKSGEFFALFGVLEKFAGIAGPGLFFIAVSVLPEDRTEMAILTILPFFFFGLLLLSKVNVTTGRRIALEAENQAG